MKGNKQYLHRTNEGIEEIELSRASGIEAPFAAPEVKSGEDILALLDHTRVLDDNTPLIVPGYRWKQLRTKPQFQDRKSQLSTMISNHPIYYYEPVELFRYTMPRKLVTYAFQGDRSDSREFLGLIRDDKVPQALEKLPTFFQPFVRSQISSLVKKSDNTDEDEPDLIDEVEVEQYEEDRKIFHAWRDELVDLGYKEYFREIVEDASKSPNACIIPPVPPILKSSGDSAIKRTKGVNRWFSDAVNTQSKGFEANHVDNYLHLYLDKGVFETDTLQRLRDVVGGEVTRNEYAGIALTISNYETAWRDGLDKTIESFVNTVSNIATEHHLPVFLPRSGWYGGYLTDHGAQGFGFMMNGNLQYNSAGGGPTDEKHRYGKIPLYGKAKKADVQQLDTVLETHQEVHPIEGLPNKPPSFNNRASDWEGKFGSPREFRIKFGKPRWLLHVQETREWREQMKEEDVHAPATEYFRKSNHPALG